MTNPAAFKATLVDFKNIRTRKLVQIVFEAPIEDANSILECLGGYGELGKESWWAVARLGDDPHSLPAKPAKERRRWDELSPATQAGIRCNEGSFQQFVKTFGDDSPEGLVRRYCYVDSRANITRGGVSGDRWAELESRYQSWLKAAEHVT